MDELLCPWAAPQFFIFSENVPTLLFYSHFTAIGAALLIGLLVFVKDPKNIVPRILLTLFAVFSLWVAIDVPLWASNRSDLVLFLWSIQILIEPIIYAIAFYLVYAFCKNKFPSFKINLLIIVLLLPIIAFLPSDLNLSGINTYDCDATEGVLALFYTYFIEILFILGIIWVSTLRYIEISSTKERIKVVYFALGLIIFLAAFASGNIIGSVTGDWDMAQYGLFGMPIFIGILAYMIVHFKAFNVKLLAAQALVVGLIVIVASMALFTRSTVNLGLIGINFILVTLGGYLLIKSVKREVEQREQIEKLAEDLQKANERLKELDKMKSEFVSIASHQLRSPITSIRGYISMLLEGSYGTFPDKAKQILQNISDSSKYMALSIEDYLNVSRIEAGNMKYEMSEFSLKDEAEKVSDELRQTAMKKGLVLVFRSDCSGSALINADIGKTRQVIMNLIDNAIKYTPKGTVTVVAHDDMAKGKVTVTIQDTGVGMSKDVLNEVFEKFVRAKNANNVNVTGTGLGLFVAKKMITQMKGRVWAESEGEGKGSSLHIEFPMLPGKANPNK